MNKDPFNIMNNFINGDLRPPLLLIKEKYDFILKQILNLVSKIVDNFSDFYSIIRDNFINDRIESIFNYIDEINETISEYNYIINNDIESFINKLSFYIFIDGLNSIDKPCNKSYCLINISNIQTYV